MDLFGRKPPSSTPTISTEAPEPQINFWRKNRTSASLFCGCILLLFVSRACSSHEKQALQIQKKEHVEEDSEREQTDKEGQIAALQSQLFKAQGTIAAVKAEGEAPVPNPLTPAQVQQMAAAGVGTLPASMVPGSVGPNASLAGALPLHQASYDNPDAAVSHESAKRVTLVISYRQDAAAVTKDEQPGAAAPGVQLGALVPSPSFPGQVSSPAVAPVSPVPSASARNPTFDAKTPNPEDQQHQLAAAKGDKYRIREGTWLPCTEQHRINGFFAGNINCLVSINIYSTSGTHVLIPQGTVALGHAAAVSGQNQQRLFVVFDELIMPDGYTVNYDNAAGLDQIGQTGLRDNVDHHYIQMFGASVGLAALSGLSQIGNYGNSAITAGSQYRAGLTQSMSESSVRILDRFTNILPTFTIREGARNNIHLPFNLWLPDYSKHAMKEEL